MNNPIIKKVNIARVDVLELTATWISSNSLTYSESHMEGFEGDMEEELRKKNVVFEEPRCKFSSQKASDFEENLITLWFP